MIKVIIDHHVKDQKDVEAVIEIIRQLRNAATRQLGNITGETLINTKDRRNILVISVWRRVEDWNAWDKSEERKKLTQQMHQLLAKPYTFRTFQYYLVEQKRKGVWSTV